MQISIRLRGGRWAIAGSVLATLALGVPAALAIHDFTDVPDASPFHGDIAAVKRAGITSGKTCVPPGTPPTYCPAEPITREAMAAFVHRGFGRVAFGHTIGSVDLDTGHAITDVVTLMLTTGGVAGGHGFVVLTGTWIAAVSTTAGCPCTARMGVSGLGSSQMMAEADIEYTASGQDSGSVSWVFPVDTATPYTFKLVGQSELVGGAVMSVDANLIAQYVPFGSTGTDVL
jgi:hypothetical protein